MKSILSVCCIQCCCFRCLCCRGLVRDTVARSVFFATAVNTVATNDSAEKYTVGAVY